MSDWSNEKPPPESVYANKVECHWCGHTLAQHAPTGDRPCQKCGRCMKYQAVSNVRIKHAERRGLRLVNWLLEATPTCDWPVGWEHTTKASHWGPDEYDIILCGKPAVGKDKYDIAYCKRHVPADHGLDAVPEKPEND